jgi:hypothetical protein
MDNPELGRKVLNVADLEPESFSMGTWGERTVCGTVACLAGHALLQSGYRLHRSGEFTRPDGTHVYSMSGEAERLLGMTGQEAQGDGIIPLWYDMFGGLDRFRKLVEEAEGRA